MVFQHELDDPGGSFFAIRGGEITETEDALDDAAEPLSAFRGCLRLRPGFIDGKKKCPAELRSGSLQTHPAGGRQFPGIPSAKYRIAIRAGGDIQSILGLVAFRWIEVFKRDGVGSFLGHCRTVRQGVMDDGTPGRSAAEPRPRMWRDWMMRRAEPNREDRTPECRDTDVFARWRGTRNRTRVARNRKDPDDVDAFLVAADGVAKRLGLAAGRATGIPWRGGAVRRAARERKALMERATPRSPTSAMAKSLFSESWAPCRASERGGGAEEAVTVTREQIIRFTRITI